MTDIYLIYIVFGAIAFLYELLDSSDWKFSLFVAIFYPVTMFLGICYGLISGMFLIVKRFKK
jgi:hypothetical protein